MLVILSATDLRLGRVRYDVNTMHLLVSDHAKFVEGAARMP